ncbi:protein of unknown function [Methylocaldum szegediense]|uniref:Uncharacterized protein n=1 Tax=Methylocaldum szegediense TaxID=73780 RepID=A0ABN8X2B1_9GAMM|nr:protein of unknown function [Methylocaldum szegediense]
MFPPPSPSGYGAPGSVKAVKGARVLALFYFKGKRAAGRASPFYFTLTPPSAPLYN